MVAGASSTARAAQQVSSGSSQITPGQASQVVREAVADFEDDYFKKRKFDPYLEFKSEEEERAFRAREAERQAEIQKALALQTPEGDLRAAQLSEAQLRDAGAHGADRSPDYAADLARLSAASSDLKTAITEQDRDADAKSRLDIVQSKQSESDVPNIPPGVLAALRQVRTPDQNAVGHGLGDKAAADSPDRPAPARG